MPAPEEPDWSQTIPGFSRDTIINLCPTFLTFPDHWQNWQEKTRPFAWNKAVSPGLQHAQEINSVRPPLLYYPDSSKPYTLFADASKHRWAGHPHTGVWNWSERKGLERTTPPSHTSMGLFHGSQLNWAGPQQRKCMLYTSQSRKLAFSTSQMLTSHLRSDLPTPSDSSLLKKHSKW